MLTDDSGVEEDQRLPLAPEDTFLDLRIDSSSNTDKDDGGDPEPSSSLRSTSLAQSQSSSRTTSSQHSPSQPSDSSGEDSSDEEVRFQRLRAEPLPTFHLALVLWTEQYSISRNAYWVLTEVLSKLDNADDIALLPHKLDTVR